jgi:hypothetical protein
MDADRQEIGKGPNELLIALPDGPMRVVVRRDSALREVVHLLGA